MPGEGFIFQGQTALKNNRSLLKRRSYFKLKTEYLEASKRQSLNLKTASPEQLKAIRQEIIAKRKKEYKTKVVALILSFIITLCTFWLAVKLGFWWFS